MTRHNAGRFSIKNRALRFALAVAAFVALPAGGAAQSACAGEACAPAAPRDARVTVVYLVRHAEKVSDGTDDPRLSGAGEHRAAMLARMFAVGITAVHTTPYRRTRATAAAIAGAVGLEPREYDPDAAEAFARTLARAGGRHVVVGHSNTIPQLVRLLGGRAEPMPETDYGRIYEVVVGPDGVHTVVVGYPN